MQIKKYTTKPLSSALLKYEGQERKKMLRYWSPLKEIRCHFVFSSIICTIKIGRFCNAYHLSTYYLSNILSTHKYILLLRQNLHRVHNLKCIGWFVFCMYIFINWAFILRCQMFPASQRVLSFLFLKKK